MHKWLRINYIDESLTVIDETLTVKYLIINNIDEMTQK
jgi:hypothetical protein